MIPKIIHYVWVGDKPKPQSVLKCIESWKKYCPDYEIKEWGNEVLNDIDNAYVKEAFEAKKWAFVSDYIRLYALEKYGGIYLDTDEELLDKIDMFLEHDFVLSHENYYGDIGLSLGFIGAAKNHYIIKDLISFYDDLHFKKKDGSFDMMPCPARFAQYFEKKFSLNAKCGEQITKLEEKSFVYPYWYFCTIKAGEKSYAVHHYDGTWLDGYRRKDIFSVGSYRFVKFKKNEQAPEENLPLREGERILKEFSPHKTRIYALVKGK